MEEKPDRTMDVVEAARLILGQCDGARALDDVGYNRVDGPIVRRLLTRPILRAKARLYLKNILAKYQRQLGGFGIEFDQIDASPRKCDLPSREHLQIALKAETSRGDRKQGWSFYRLIENGLSKEEAHLALSVIREPESESERRLIEELQGEADVVVGREEADQNGNGERWLQRVREGDAACVRQAKKGLLLLDQQRAKDYKSGWIFYRIRDSGIYQDPDAFVKFLQDREIDIREALGADVEGANPAISTEDILASIPQDRLEPLFPFQIEVVQEAIHAPNGSALLGLEMGTGKTPISLVATLNAKPLLVICPAAIKRNWARETKRWTGRDAYVLNGGHRNGSSIPSDPDVVIINYDILGKHLKDLLQIEWQALIVDESHYAKNIKAARTKAVIEISMSVRENSGRVYALTGTPVLNRPSEIWGQLALLGHDLTWTEFRVDKKGERKLVTNFYKFSRKWCGGYKGKWGFVTDDDDGADREGLSRKMEGTLIRRLKKDVIKDLPALIRSWIDIDPDPKIERRYQAALDDILEYLRRSRGDKAARRAARAKALVQIGQLRQLAALSRAETVADMAAEAALDEGVQILLFANFLEPLEKIREILEAKEVEVAWITGEVSSEERQEEVDRFQAGDARVLLATCKAAGIGLNLQAGDQVWFLDLAWTPADHTQAEARSWRIGREERVEAKYFYSDGLPTDHSLRKFLARKIQAICETVGGGAEEGILESDGQDRVLDELWKRL